MEEEEGIRKRRRTPTRCLSSRGKGGGWEGGREGGREGGKEGGREGWREGRSFT